MRNKGAAVAWVFLGAIAILAASCSSIPSSGLSSAKTGRVELGDDFKNGEARLGCQLHCAITWGLYRDRAKALYNARAWNDLALNVLRIGYADDLSYFYLGKAAEGLGHYRAAEIDPTPSRPRVTIQRPYFDASTSQTVDRTLIMMSH